MYRYGSSTAVPKWMSVTLFTGASDGAGCARANVARQESTMPTKVRGGRMDIGDSAGERDPHDYGSATRP